MRVSVLGFGAAEIGFEETSQNTVNALVQEAFDAGVNVIDTAECYRDSEEMIGKAIRNRRNDCYLFTKCGHPRGVESGANWSRDSILESMQRSLRRLQTEHVDLMQLHSCDGMCCAKAKRSTHCKQRAIAATHATLATAVTDSPLSMRLSAARSIRSRLQSTSPTRKQSRWCYAAAIKNEMGVIAKRPVANVAWKSNNKPAQSYHHEYWERLRKLDYPFLHTTNLDKAVAMALRFTLSVPGVHLAIVGTTKPERWKQNAAFLEGGLLGDGEFEQIRERWSEVAPTTWIGQV